MLVRWPALTPLAVLVAAPFRPPLDFGSSNTFLVSIATDGRLGRLLPLYFVLGAAGLALAWRALRDEPPQPVPHVLALPAAAFFAFACVSLLWAKDVEAGTNLLVFFTLPFALLLVDRRALALPGLAAARARDRGARAGRRCSRSSGLSQAVTHKLFFYAPNLAVSNANTDYFRVTSLFGDPSLYGRHVVLGICVDARAAGRASAARAGR